MSQDYCHIFRPLDVFRVHCNIAVATADSNFFSRFKFVTLAHKIMSV
jgi:hypothetical protein